MPTDRFRGITSELTEKGGFFMKKFAVTPLDVLLNEGVSFEELEIRIIQLVMREKVIPIDRNIGDLKVIGFELSNHMVDEVFQEIKKLPNGWTRVIGEGRRYFFRDEKKRNRIMVTFHPREGEYMAFAEILPFYNLSTIKNGVIWESTVFTPDGKVLFTASDKDGKVAKEFVELLALENGIDLNDPLIGW